MLYVSFMQFVQCYLQATVQFGIFSGNSCAPSDCDFNIKITAACSSSKLVYLKEECKKDNEKYRRIHQSKNITNPDVMSLIHTAKCMNFILRCPTFELKTTKGS